MPELLITLVLVGIGWFVLIRPQQARARAQRAMIEALEQGDMVITAGGIHGQVIEVAHETVVVRVADGVDLTMARMAIARQIDLEPAPRTGEARADEVEDQVPETLTDPGEGPAHEDHP